MGVYIKGMEMPGRCGSCPCFHAEHPIYCRAVKTDRSKRIAAPYGLPRPDWCPLVEVPPHGRLIDEEAVIDHFVSLSNNGWNQNVRTSWANAFAEAASDICDIPTIIEAEE